MKRVLSSLLLVLLLLCGLTDRAEGAATPLQKTASGSFGENPNKRAYVDPLLVVELQRDFELWGYDLGLGVDVGPNLYAYVRQNPWTAFDPLGLRLERGEGWTDEEWEQQEEHLSNIRESDYYEESRFREVDESEDYVARIDKIEESARGVAANTRYHAITETDRENDPSLEGIDGQILISPDQDFRRIGEDGASERMSVESVYVHETMHGWDHMNDPEAYHDQSGALRNFFRQTPENMGRFPNQLERRAVEEANRYRAAVGEPARARYRDRAGIMRYHGIRRNNYQAISREWEPRFDTFHQNRNTWNRANPENRFDHSGYIHGRWPPSE